MSRHHGPLVAFTSLAIAGAGLVAANASAGALGDHAWMPAVGAALMGAAIAVSLAHLGRKRRAAMAARGAGRSALSNEVIAATVAALSAALAALLGAFGRPSAVVSVVAGLASAAFLLSVGLVYRLRGQRTWRGFTIATPLTGGLAFGAAAVQAASASSGLLSGTLLAVAIDALVFSQRWRDVAAAGLPSAAQPEPWWRRRIQLLGARFFLMDALPFFFLATGAAHVAVLCAAAGLVADRFAFYALAVQHTTEHEVAAIEERLSAIEREP